MSDFFFFFLYYQSSQGPVHKGCDEPKCVCVRYKKKKTNKSIQQKYNVISTFETKNIYFVVKM